MAILGSERPQFRVDDLDHAASLGGLRPDAAGAVAQTRVSFEVASGSRWCTPSRRSSLPSAYAEQTGGRTARPIWGVDTLGGSHALFVDLSRTGKFVGCGRSLHFTA